MFMRFIQQVRAESFPTKISWNWRDTFAILIIPLIFMNSFLIQYVSKNILVIGISDAIFRGVLFLLVCYLYKTMLLEHWQKYKQAFWQSCLLVVLGTIAFQIVIHVTRQFLPQGQGGEPKAYIDLNHTHFMVLLMMSLGPLFTALLEDIVFRYTLLQKLFIRPFGWRVVLVILNSVLFGLIHYYNFGGDVLATVSFMTAGLFLNLVYLWTRNIWHVLLIHFVNNAVLSLGGLILFKVVQLLL